MKPLIYFAHGNGFPSLCYQQLLHQLSLFSHCIYLERIGHSQQFPVSENWDHLVQEILHDLQLRADKPVIGVGHSLGGILLALAAIKRPELFQHLILLDSPLIGRFKSKMIRLFKKLNWIDRVTPAHRVRYRKVSWRTREEALAYFKSKLLFKYFTPDCLEDYITHGLTPNEQGFELWFERDIEYQIYRTLPHVLHRYEGQLTVPTHLVYGTKSRVIQAFDRRYMRRFHHIQAYPLPGTHMFPMEVPDETAALIKQLIHTTNKNLLLNHPD